MSISDKFKSFLNSIRTNNDDTVSLRCKGITKRLNKDFWNSESNTSHSFYVGSYGRGTAIKGFSDVDLMMRLPAEVYYKYDSYTGNGQSALLQAVKDSLAKKYPVALKQKRIQGDGQVVVVQFSDNMCFEVVPVFLSETDKYIFPDSNNGGRWKSCDPKSEIKRIRELNNNYNGKIKHLVRMMKCWKRKNNVQISGILLETLACNFMKEWSYNDKSYMYYDWMVRDFLKYLKDLDKDKEYWIIPGSGQRAYKTGNFQYKANQGFNVASSACDYESGNKNYSANNKWNELFGNYF